MQDDEMIQGAFLRAALDAANGLVGRFVLLAEVAAAAELSDGQADAALQQLRMSRRVHQRGQAIAVSKCGVEAAINWTNADLVLRALLNSGGGLERPAELDVITAASGLPESKVTILLNELSTLGHAGCCLIEHPDGRTSDGAFITAAGWERLNHSLFSLDPR